jgi:CBS domain-containing protein
MIKEIRMEKAEDIMSKEVIIIEKNKGLSYIINVLASSAIGSVIITEKGKPTGIITERDIIKALNNKNMQLKGKSIDDIMKNELISVSKNTRFTDIHKIINENHIRHLPVIEDDRVIGIISHAEITKHAHNLHGKNIKFMKYQNIQTAIILIFFAFMIIILLYRWATLS